LEITGGNDDLKHALGTGDIASENKVEGDAIVIFKKFDEGRNDLIESLTDVEGIFLFFKKKIEKTKKYKTFFFFLRHKLSLKNFRYRQIRGHLPSKKTNEGPRLRHGHTRNYLPTIVSIMSGD
jgi:hypothetical protein